MGGGAAEWRTVSSVEGPPPQAQPPPPAPGWKKWLRAGPPSPGPRKPTLQGRPALSPLSPGSLWASLSMTLSLPGPAASPCVGPCHLSGFAAWPGGASVAPQGRQGSSWLLHMGPWHLPLQPAQPLTAVPELPFAPPRHPLPTPQLSLLCSRQVRFERSQTLPVRGHQVGRRPLRKRQSLPRTLFRYLRCWCDTLPPPVHACERVGVLAAAHLLPSGNGEGGPWGGTLSPPPSGTCHGAAFESQGRGPSWNTCPPSRRGGGAGRRGTQETSSARWAQSQGEGPSLGRGLGPWLSRPGRQRERGLPTPAPEGGDLAGGGVTLQPALSLH